jgi:hypothetical protein
LEKSEFNDEFLGWNWQGEQGAADCDEAFSLSGLNRIAWYQYNRTGIFFRTSGSSL